VEIDDKESILLLDQDPSTCTSLSLRSAKEGP